MNVFGFVQAGGASTRFGTDKALVRIAGKTMLERAADLIASVCQDTRIVASAGKYEHLSWPTLNDQWPGEGPLGGILTALHHLNRLGCRDGDRPMEKVAPSLAIIVSCDMPFLTQDLLRLLSDRAMESAAEVVVPQSGGGLEPLCACWKATAIEGAQSAFDAGVRKVTDAMKRLPTEVLDESVWKRFDKNGRLFWNMNTPEDFEEARRILESDRHE